MAASAIAQRQQTAVTYQADLITADASDASWPFLAGARPAARPPPTAVNGLRASLSAKLSLTHSSIMPSLISGQKRVLTPR